MSISNATNFFSGGKRGHKGGRRHFTDPRALEEAQAKEAKEKEWRKQRGELSESESGEEDEEKKSESEEEESSEEESSGDEGRRPKGAEGLIEVENPNRVQVKQKKVSALNNDTSGGKPQLSRREREELEKQRAKAHYQKLHAAGKTEEARADLARLAIIKKQREEAAKKREEEKKGKKSFLMLLV